MRAPVIGLARATVAVARECIAMGVIVVCKEGEGLRRRKISGSESSQKEVRLKGRGVWQEESRPRAPLIGNRQVAGWERLTTGLQWCEYLEDG